MRDDSYHLTAEVGRLRAENERLRRDLAIWRRNGGDDLMRAECDELLAAANLARICLKNRDQSEYEAKAYAAICAAIAKAERK
jgi:hypothetical protein